MSEDIFADLPPYEKIDEVQPAEPTAESGPAPSPVHASDDNEDKSDSEKEGGKEGEETKDGGKKKKRKRLDWTKAVETFYLDVYQAGKVIDRIPLGKKERVMFGRDKKWDVVLHNPSTSRKHCAIAVGVPPTAPAGDQGGVTLLDFGTNNGTYWTSSYPCRPDTGRQRVPKMGAVTLKDGYCFRCGDSSQCYVVRGLDGNRHANPNFAKVVDSEEKGRNNALSKDFGLEGVTVKKGGHGAMISRNPFKDAYREDEATAGQPLHLPTVKDDALKKKILSGETTFSFHNKLKTEFNNIRYEHEHKLRKRVLELKREQADCQSQLDMTTK